MIFAAAGQDYEDIRIERENLWPKIKPTTPTGQVPVLEVIDSKDGSTLFRMSQSIAIG